MNKEEAKAIWDRYLQGTASDEEKALVESWYNQMIDQQPTLPEGIDYEVIGAKLSKNLTTRPKSGNKYRQLRRVATIAAALLLMLGVVLYLQLQRPQPIPEELVNTLIVPGGNKATLRLADGTVIQLSEDQSGIVVTDEQAYYADGTTLLDGDTSEKTENMQYLALSTPIGGQYQVTLPDGTRVWLNASSSLTYPSSFAQSGERVVELKGEAYFEVVQDARKPFKVKSSGQTVQVLGTAFNVNAYEDEAATTTTLLKGEVAVTIPSGETKHLTPDQQSQVKADDTQIYIQTVDGPDVIDWKNGDFVFNNESLERIMRKISRWYDVDVEFRGKIPSVNFGGVISRSKNITEVLQILELTEAVKFKFEETKNIGKGRRIVVMP